ncbi:hypothetical protein CO051_03830, partial [Candidatus Roizmanbacteria bacterium CG_4_9_14_0_2_um_filter_39_13]
MEYSTGSHTTYYLTYHIVWCTKYRYQILMGEVAIRARELIQQIARYIENQDTKPKQEDDF